MTAPDLGPWLCAFSLCSSRYHGRKGKRFCSAKCLIEWSKLKKRKVLLRST